MDTGHNLTYFPDLKVLASIKNFDNYKEKIINLLSENISPFALRSLENQIVMELLNDYNNENFIDFTYKYPNANKFYNILNEVLEIKREKEKTNVDETISK